MKYRIMLCLILMSFLCAHAQQPECAHDGVPADVDAKIDALLTKMTTAEKISQLEDRAPAIPRLGILGYNWWTEGLHGIARNGYATVFPQAIGLAATWDSDLLHSVGEVVSKEARVNNEAYKGLDSPRNAGLSIWSPNINIFRDPRWGRGQETYGEDPYLTSRLGVAFVRGLQGDDAFYRRTDATPKHFAVHSGPESGRDSFNSVVSQHDLNDTYFVAFRTIVSEARPAALMCSYNAINGTPSCASATNLQSTVRDRWGFDGYVVSDCDAIGNIDSYQHFAKTASEGAALALKAGVDLNCGNSYNALAKSLDSKLVDEQRLDTALRRLFKARLQLGNLTASDCSLYAAERSNEAANASLAERAAEESIVLLKNDGTLPLQAKRKVAVIGPTADLLKVLEANYHGTARHPVSLLKGLEQTLGPLTYAQGSLLADGLTLHIPRTALRVDNGVNAAQGLHAEYFSGESFEGTPSHKTTVEQVDFDLDRVGPDPAITSKHYAARWSGNLQTPAGGDYLLRVAIERCWDCTTHDRYALYVDGKLALVNDGHAAAPDSVTIHDASPASHAVKLELIHTGEDEGIALEWTPPAQALLAEAVEATRTADVIVACVGLSPDLEGEALSIKLDGFDGGDRTSLDLPKAQTQLLRVLQKLGKRMIIVVTSGSAVSLKEFAPGAAAILQTWYPGQSGGTALARVLSGEVNPSGRLPVTFYRTVNDLPAFTDYRMANRTYRYFNGDVEFPFGYGLSYSSFRYGGVKLSHTTFSKGETLTAQTRVTNASDRAGDEVVQLYVKAMQTQGAPRISLKAFQRITLRPHESQMVTFRLSADAFSTVGTDGHRAVKKDIYRIFVRGSQPDRSTPGRDISISNTWAFDDR